MQGKVMVVRAKPHGINREDEFLGGMISIGWPTGSSYGDKGKEEIENLVPPKWRSRLTASQILNFVTIPIGTIILTPSVETRGIHIFRTIGTYNYDPSRDKNDIGNPHTIPVEFIKTVPRDTFSELVQRALNAARKGVSIFTKYSPEIMRIAHDNIDRNAPKPEPQTIDPVVNDKATQALVGLLDSENEEIRLKAALALLGK